MCQNGKCDYPAQFHITSDSPYIWVEKDLRGTNTSLKKLLADMSDEQRKAISHQFHKQRGGTVKISDVTELYVCPESFQKVVKINGLKLYVQAESFQQC